MIDSCKRFLIAARLNYPVHGSLFVLFIVSWLLFGGWFWETPRLLTATQFLMDTSVTVKVYVRDSEKGEKLIKKAFAEGARIEHIMEPLKGTGELQKINASPDKLKRVVSPELLQVLVRSKFFYNLTGGAFDPTIAPVKWLWDFEIKRKVPGDQEIQDKLRFVSFAQVKLNEDSIEFAHPEIQLDLGGVAKGYAVDRMIAVLKDGGITAGLVNAGGDIYSFGKKPGNVDWIIGISHPRLSLTIRPDKTIQLASVATSGDYQRFFMEDGIRYHHILDPSTGYPARECISVTVWAENATDADILATAIFVMGPEKGIELAESLDNVETLIFFEKDGKVGAVMSSGIKDKVRL